MVTKSLIETPFGSKFIYRIDGEYTWSEYIAFDNAARNSVAQRLMVQMHRVWDALSRRLQNAW
ncbi:MAG: hypothetical protein FJ295_09135 [Planctomycetes bacterium]|nr:hypothetical protein [Planctomycetota bacterium]